MNSNRSSSSTPDWLKGRGIGPKLKWTYGTDGPLTACALARETGEVFVGDETGTLCRLDRAGQIQTMTRVPGRLLDLVWSDDGSSGAAFSAADEIIRFSNDLKTTVQISLPDTGISLAISPFGNQLACGLANGTTMIFNDRKRRIAQFDTMRPLSFLQFCTTEPTLFGSAENGLIGAYNLEGHDLWEEKNWSNVGDLKITGDGDMLYLASFGQGIQAIDGDGAARGSYVLDGTVKLLDVSFEPSRMIVSTIERSLYWVDSDGELLWATDAPDDVKSLSCDPLGEWVIVAFENHGVMRLNWGG